MKKAEKIAREMLEKAGVEIGVSHPWDMRVHDSSLYETVLAGGSLALGESYMDGLWDCDAVDQLTDRIVRARLNEQVTGLGKLEVLGQSILSRLMNRQTVERSGIVAKRHYDLGNDLYRAMLGERMVYTCGYWNGLEPVPENLDRAQDAKLDLVCRKIGLDKNGDGKTVLDVGCGWGSFAKFAAEKYGAHVTGVSISEEQVRLGNELCSGLPVELRIQDYRKVGEVFDHVISLGMFEHVGPKNYGEYMRKVKGCVDPHGLFLLHTIGGEKSKLRIDPWVEKYIFPNAVIPSVKQIADASEGVFVMEDWHNIGEDYDKTLMAWYSNFERAWPKFKDEYGKRFRRMWEYYLKTCAGTFRARKNQLWQIVLSPHGVDGGYETIR